jgi:hypothetical protein
MLPSDVPDPKRSSNPSNGEAAMNPSEYIDQPALHAAQDDLRRFLTDLIKAGLVYTQEAALARWREDALKRREELTGRLASLTDEEVHLDVLWVQARQEAQNDDLVRAEGSMKPILQAKCLFTLPELLAPDFSFEAAAARIRISTATG